MNRRFEFCCVGLGTWAIFVLVHLPLGRASATDANAIGITWYHYRVEHYPRDIRIPTLNVKLGREETNEVQRGLTPFFPYDSDAGPFGPARDDSGKLQQLPGAALNARHIGIQIDRYFAGETIPAGTLCFLADCRDAESLNVYCDSCRLEQGALKFIQHMPRLKHALIRGRQFDGSAFDGIDFERLSCEDMTFRDTALDEAHFRDLAKCPNLKRLHLYGGRFFDSECEALGEWEHLEYLLISGQQFRGTSLKAIGRCAKLRDLTIQDAGVGDAEIALLGKMESLEHLSLVETYVTDAVIPLIVKQFPNLKTLDLSGTQVTSRNLAQLAKCSHLTTLSLEHTYIDERCFDALTQIKSLKYVDLYDEYSTNRLDEEAVRAFMEANGLERSYHYLSSKSPPVRRWPRFSEPGDEVQEVE